MRSRKIKGYAWVMSDIVPKNLNRFQRTGTSLLLRMLHFLGQTLIEITEVNPDVIQLTLPE